jgi:KH domain
VGPGTDGGPNVLAAAITLQVPHIKCSQYPEPPSIICCSHSLQSNHLSYCAGAALKFELAVGLNGRVWVAASDTLTTIMVANAIQQAEALSEAQAHIFVKVCDEADTSVGRTPLTSRMTCNIAWCKPVSCCHAGKCPLSNPFGEYCNQAVTPAEIIGTSTKNEERGGLRPQQLHMMRPMLAAARREVTHQVQK